MQGALLNWATAQLPPARARKGIWPPGPCELRFLLAASRFFVCQLCKHPRSHCGAVGRVGPRSLGCTSPAPQVLPHPPAAPSPDKGRLLPAPSRCWDVPGQIPLASMQPPKTRSAGVQTCRDVLGHTQRGLCRHVARAWGPRASVGSTANPLELGGKDPSLDNPTPAWPGLPRLPNPAVVPVEVRGQGVFGTRAG